MRSLPLLSSIAALLLGCAANHSTEPQAPPQYQEPALSTDPITVAGYSASELASEFERARSLLLTDRFEEAARAFDRLMRLADDSEIAATSMFNSGVAYEALGDRTTALERFRELTEKHPKEGSYRPALVRLSRLYGYLERWSELEQAAATLLAIDELPVMDRIEGHGALALALVELARLEEAQRELTLARDLIDRHRFGEGGTPPVQLAQVAFALGEVRRVEGERIQLVVTDAAGRLVPAPAFTDTLERRCQGLLDAQSAYTEAMRARDSHWSAMAGFRVGSLYQQLHREAMQIPAPENAITLEQRQLFEGAMRLRYRILLEKGLKMMDATVRLGERTGESSDWIARAREAKRQLDQSLADERAALAKLPFTEEEMRAALDKLKGPSAASAQQAIKPASGPGG